VSSTPASAGAATRPAGSRPAPPDRARPTSNCAFTAATGRVGRRCGVAGCGRAHHGHGYCRTHHDRWRRHGDPRADVPVASRTSGGYWSALNRVRRERGPANTQRCACSAPADCWSYNGGDPDERTAPRSGYRYSLDPARYRPRCRSCHRRATQARAPRGSRTAVDMERAAQLYRAGASGPGIAALLGVSRTAVYTALRAHGVPLRHRGNRGPS
jgi:hypothetical protein